MLVACTCRLLVTCCEKKKSTGNDGKEAFFYALHPVAESRALGIKGKFDCNISLQTGSSSEV